MNKEFAKDIIAGLSQSPKQLSSKYFYDETGSKLFQEIMQLNTYYLTDCEFEIFSTKKEEILKIFQDGVEEFELVEFGAGDGFKTKLLLDHFLKSGAMFKYAPVDISKTAVNNLASMLRKKFPALEVEALHDDYFNALETLNEAQPERKIILFLGANIGNFDHKSAVSFLKSIRENLLPQDYLMIGFDLRKNPQTILKAYNDHFGVTKAFNLNLLKRINEEFEGTINVANFDHYPFYEPISGEARSYIISLKDQEFYLKKLDKTFHLKQWEYIHTEISKKYSLEEIEALAAAAGFDVKHNLLDCRHYFVDSVWSPRSY